MLIRRSVLPAVLWAAVVALALGLTLGCSTPAPEPAEQAAAEPSEEPGAAAEPAEEPAAEPVPAPETDAEPTPEAPDEAAPSATPAEEPTPEVARVTPLPVTPLGPGDWPQFRGPNRDGISPATGLNTDWPESGPKVLWTVGVAQGYSTAAIVGGRVYFNDYDEDASEWLVRCLDLESGEELWRFKERRRIRPNHLITRTVPAVDGRYLVSIDPKAVIHGIDATTGKQLWRQNMVEVYGTQIPPWYNGQCPLLEEDRVIIATGGPEALIVALEKATGKEIWRTANADEHQMSHSSLMPATIGGVDQYLYGTLKGLLGVRAADGQLLWFHPRKFNVAVSPSPIQVGADRVFLTSPYEGGTIMIRVRREGDAFRTETVFDHDGSMWNSEIHTPIIFQDHLFAVGKKKRGMFTCLDFDGNEVWTSDRQAYFEMGSFLLADGKFFILEGKTGMLRVIAASTSGYQEVAHAQVLSGHDVWGPMALSDKKLVIRDVTKMVCLDLS